MYPVVLGAVGQAIGLGLEEVALVAAQGSVSGPAWASTRLLGLDPFAVVRCLARTGAHHRGNSRRCRWPELEPLSPEVTTVPRCPLAPPLCSRSGPSATRPGRCASLLPDKPLRVGIGGPVGSGKTALVAALCRSLAARWSVAVVTNDIYTTEDAQILLREAVLPPDRIRAVQTGCCPHTAIRDDISANLEAVETLGAAHPGLDLVLIESGGDNLTATFSYGLVHTQIFVIDVAGGDKVPRKGGPGITLSDLLVINKTDLAPLVSADLEVMRRDAATARKGSPFVFLSLSEDPLAEPVAGVARCHAVRAVRAHAELRVSAPLCPKPGGAKTLTAQRSKAPAGGEVPPGSWDLAYVRDAPPVAFRATPEAVYLVGTAAFPVGDDCVSVEVEVGEGAALPVRSAASMIAWASSQSRFDVEVTVRPGASLDWQLQPLVASSACHFSQRARASLAEGATLLWGRNSSSAATANRRGTWTWPSTSNTPGAPLLRHQLMLGPGSRAGTGRL